MAAIATGIMLLIWGLWLILHSPRISALFAASLRGQDLPGGEPRPLIASLAGCCLIGCLISSFGVWVLIRIPI